MTRYLGLTVALASAFVSEIMILATAALLWSGIDLDSVTPVASVFAVFGALPVAVLAVETALERGYPARLRLLRPCFWTQAALLVLSVFLHVERPYVLGLVVASGVLAIPALLYFTVHTRSQRVEFEAALARGEAQRPVRRFPV